MFDDWLLFFIIAGEQIELKLYNAYSDFIVIEVQLSCLFIAAYEFRNWNIGIAFIEEAEFAYWNNLTMQYGRSAYTRYHQSICPFTIFILDACRKGLVFGFAMSYY